MFARLDCEGGTIVTGCILGDGKRLQVPLELGPIARVHPLFSQTLEQIRWHRCLSYLPIHWKGSLLIPSTEWIWWHQCLCIHLVQTKTTDTASRGMVAVRLVSIQGRGTGATGMDPVKGAGGEERHQCH